MPHPRARYADVPGGSNRQFGLVFSVFFAVVALLPLRSGDPVRLWALPVALLFAVLALAIPRVLGPFNAAWTKLGLLLGAVVSPIVLTLVFFLGFAPIGLVMRALGRRPIPLVKDPDATTYWIERRPPGPPPETMKNQF